MRLSDYFWAHYLGANSNFPRCQIFLNLKDNPPDFVFLEKKSEGGDFHSDESVFLSWFCAQGPTLGTESTWQNFYSRAQELKVNFGKRKIWIGLKDTHAETHQWFWFFPWDETEWRPYYFKTDWYKFWKLVRIQTNVSDHFCLGYPHFNGFLDFA